METKLREIMESAGFIKECSVTDGIFLIIVSISILYVYWVVYDTFFRDKE